MRPQVKKGGNGNPNPIQGDEHNAPGLYQILINSKTGDPKAFQKLVEHYSSYLYILAYRLLDNPEDAGDAVQETFIKVWKHISKFDLNRKFSTWLYRIVTNICFDYLRSRKRKPYEPYPEDIPMDYDPQDTQIIRDRADLVKKLAGELTPKQKIVFVLRDLQDLDIKEVASITGMSLGTVKSNLYYARRNLRERLEQMDRWGGN